MGLIYIELKDGRFVLGTNTSDQVFGPIFESEQHVEDFCAYAESQGVERGDVRKLTEPGIGSSLRDRELCDMYNDWFETRVDGESGALLEPTTGRG